MHWCRVSGQFSYLWELQRGPVQRDAGPTCMIRSITPESGHFFSLNDNRNYSRVGHIKRQAIQVSPGQSTSGVGIRVGTYENPQALLLMNTLKGDLTNGTTVSEQPPCSGDENPPGVKLLCQSAQRAHGPSIERDSSVIGLSQVRVQDACPAPLDESDAVPCR